MAPLVKLMKSRTEFRTMLCSTGQHREMLHQVMSLFELSPDIDLEIMKADQDLIDVTTGVLQGLKEIFDRDRPDLILVHGDTNTTFATTLAAYYCQIPVHHVEAGLRTGNLMSPWPEEGNRKLTSALAAHHYAPTSLSRQNLIREGVPEHTISVTGNTVIDALFNVSKRLDDDVDLRESILQSLPEPDPARKLILVTSHRRENFGEGFENICKAIAELAQRDDVQIIYPVHLNPNVQEPVNRHLRDLTNVHLIPSQGYPAFTHLMKQSHIILTDSGGIQEEAPALGKPVLLMRDTTERPEAVKAGTVALVGTNQDKIVQAVCRLLDDEESWKSMSQSINPYGDGTACQQIIDRLLLG